MTLSDSTKRMFVDGLEELMLTKPLEKIRITELCRLCDADRQMFYYHFPDK